MTDASRSSAVPGILLDPSSGLPLDNPLASDRDIRLTRVFDAPRELVFHAFVDPEHIGDWWGPDGFTITTHAMDVRPGGTWSFIMHGPDGTDYPNTIVYRVIEPPGRLIFAHVEDDGRELFETTVTLEERDGKTHLTFLARFPSRDARDFVVREHHAVEGGRQTLARLAGEVERRVAAQEIVSTRLLAAPRHRVFAAFRDPARLAQWWGPAGFTNVFDTFELRPGGAWRFVMRGPDGTEHQMVKQFVEVIPDDRIVLRHLEPPHHRFTMIMTFDRAGATALTWRMRFDSEAELAAVKTAITAANEENFDRLAALLAPASE